MALPFFFIEPVHRDAVSIALDADSSRHIVQVLRMKAGETIMLTDGAGEIFKAIIEKDHKKECLVRIIERRREEYAGRSVDLAVSLVKNRSRFEWMLEKVTEIGVRRIIVVNCERSEKQQYREERMRGILISAMLQSQQSRMPELVGPVGFEKFVKESEQERKFIAHCAGGEKSPLAGLINPFSKSQLILIGPEGDFTDQEIGMAIAHQFIPVALGKTRLRTETAALVAATLLKLAGE